MARGVQNPDRSGLRHCPSQAGCKSASIGLTRARVHFHVRFERDLRAHRDWIVTDGQMSWLDALEAGLNETAALLADFPKIGMVAAENESAVVRRLVWTYAPYVSWYAHRASTAVRDIWLIRSFHARQRRSLPDVLFWGAEIEDREK